MSTLISPPCDGRACWLERTVPVAQWHRVASERNSNRVGLCSQFWYFAHQWLFPISLGFFNITLALFSIWLLGFLEPEVGLWTGTCLCCQCRPLRFQLQAPSALDRPSLACGLLCLVKTPAHWSWALATRHGVDLVLAPIEVSHFFFSLWAFLTFLITPQCT